MVIQMLYVEYEMSNQAERTFIAAVRITAKLKGIGAQERWANDNIQYVRMQSIGHRNWEKTSKQPRRSGRNAIKQPKMQFVVFISLPLKRNKFYFVRFSW